MAIIKKKIPPEYFDIVNSGKKNFELRVAEFEVKEGDTIILEEWDPKTKQYTGRTIEREAGYVLDFKLNTFGQEELIKEKGPEQLVLITDAGQPGNNPVPGWKMFIKTLLAQGVSEAHINIMAKDVPAKLIYG